MIDGVPPGLLGRHVSDGAHGRAYPGELRAARHPGEAEVHDLGPALRCHDDVRRLDVAVDDAPLVCGGESLRDLDSDVERVIGSERAGRDLHLQVLSLNTLHRDEGPSVGLVDLEDRTDVGVVERGSGLRLLDEPFRGRGITGRVRGQELEGHRPFQPGVLGLVDDTHAAFAELLGDPVVGDGLADHGSSPIFSRIALNLGSSRSESVFGLRIMLRSRESFSSTAFPIHSKHPSMSPSAKQKLARTDGHS